MCLNLFFNPSFGQWKELNEGLYGGWVRDMLQHDDTIYVTTNGGVYRSVDDGRTWERFNEGIEWSAYVGSVFACTGEVIISTSSNHQYRLAADGRSWVRIVLPLR